MKKNEFPKWVEMENLDYFGPPTIWVKMGRWDGFEGLCLKTGIFILFVFLVCFVWENQATKAELRPVVVEAPVATIRMAGAKHHSGSLLWEVKLQNGHSFVVERSYTKEAPTFVVK